MRTADYVPPKTDSGRAVFGTFHVLFFASVYLSFSTAIFSQTSDSSADGSNKSWTATTDSKADSGNPTRTFERHTQSGNRTVDVRSLETRGPDGNYAPYQDIETETVRGSAGTTRITTRTFVHGGSGAKTLFQVTEEERRVLSDGDSKLMRTTSNPDSNGRLQVVQREVQETRKSSPDVQETKTTVMLPGINGGFAPAMQTQERQIRSGTRVEIQKTTLLPDAAGSWQVGEVRHEVIKDEDKNRNKEERVSRPDAEGNLQEITRTVEKESEDATGARRNSEETYSIDLQGATRDNALHLIQRVTTTQRSSSGGRQTTELVEQPKPGDPSAGLWVTTVNSDTVRPTSSGAQSTRTIQMRDANGSLNIVSVDTKKSDNVKAVEVQIAPSKPK